MSTPTHPRRTRRAWEADEVAALEALRAQQLPWSVIAQSVGHPLHACAAKFRELNGFRVGDYYAAWLRKRAGRGERPADALEIAQNRPWISPAAERLIRPLLAAQGLR